ncbi:MAG: threonine--tRNA ligase [Proteobacteria bacterium]|nr:threonine--tRNA ligase [Pseudomonadota bacterium]
METIKIKLPGGVSHTVEKGKLIAALLSELQINPAAIAATLDGHPVDLNTPLVQDAEVSFIDISSDEGREILRHSTSHVMAQAVKTLYPGIKVTIGPSIENGFYYDFYYDNTFSPEDLNKIEIKMQDIIDQNILFTRVETSREDAIKLFAERKEDYKVEIIREIPSPTVSLYQQGDFIDLCRGPHLPSTGKIRAFKLLSIAGAYWRGDERNKMLQRIYGTAFPSGDELQRHIKLVEEAKARDHRKLGRELDLFNIYDEVGAGLIVYHPRGAMLRRILEDFEVREHLKRGYQMVKGPQILRQDLWQKSGHLDNYRQFMYFTEVDGQKYGLKPMNCVAHMLIYKSKLHSYRDLPVRYFELGTVNRHEKSGVLHGLTRVREFTQDDAHILCTPDQLDQEIARIIDFVRDVMGIFQFTYEMELSTRPEKSIGTDEDWERATAALRTALDKNHIPYDINEGDGAFYGPKIDVKLKDCLGRSWQCATIQCDFALPDRFDLFYIGEDGAKHRPVMLHRVILGSIERFLGVLIEHYAGAFPTWLSPVQAIVLPIADRHFPYGEEVFKQLIDNDIRAEIDLRNESLRLKIREAQLQKTPYMLVIGDREVENKGISPRQRSGEDLKFMHVDQLIDVIRTVCRQELQVNLQKLQ